MINHARTLLMNVNGSTPMLNFVAEEIVDPDFVALDLPPALLAVRSILFGATPDRDMLNYRCRQLLAVAHATPLEQYLTAFDKRITYSFADETLAHPEPWVPSVGTQVGSKFGATLTVLGAPEPPDKTGRLRNTYNVEVTGSGSGTIARVTAPISKVDFDFTVGSRTALPGCGCTFKLSSLQAYQLHRVEVLSRPQKALADLLDAVSHAGEPTLIDVFGLSNAEPHRTFRNIWNRSPELPLRVGALVCAMTYRAEQVRGGA